MLGLLVEMFAILNSFFINLIYEYDDMMLYRQRSKYNSNGLLKPVLNVLQNVCIQCTHRNTYIILDPTHNKRATWNVYTKLKQLYLSTNNSERRKIISGFFHCLVLKLQILKYLT